MKLEFSGQIFGGKDIQMSNFMKIRPVGEELILSDGHDEADHRPSQFRERPPSPRK